MAWDGEKVDLLLKLNNQSYSASQIAQQMNDQLGTAITRNAVIGRLNRMGLSCGGGKPSPSPQAGLRSRLKGGKEEGARGLVLGGGGRSLKPILLKPKTAQQARLAQRNISIHKLTDNTCRFPMGEPQDENFAFCGADKTRDDLPYCDYHTQLAHQRSKRAS